MPVLWLSVPERTIGHHVMPAEAGESLCDREMKDAANWTPPVPRLRIDFSQIACTYCADLDCAHAGHGNYDSFLFGVGNRAATRTPVHDATNEANACGERAGQIGRQPRRPIFVHGADGGSISGAGGVKSRDADGSSTCNFKSAAFSISAAEILGSLVALANLNKIAA